MKCKNIPDIATVPSIMLEGSYKIHNYLAGNHVRGIMKQFILCLSMIVRFSTSKIANCHSSLLQVHLIVLTAQLHTSVLASHV